MSDFNKKNFNYNIKPYVVPSPNEIEQMACEYPMELFGCEGFDGDYVFYKVIRTWYGFANKLFLLLCWKHKTKKLSIGKTNDHFISFGNKIVKLATVL